jgi:hypothetical protein
MSSTDTNTRGLGCYTERQMVTFAKDRTIVRLADGTLATLVSWGCKAGRAKVRLEGCDGKTRWTAKKLEIIEVLVNP